MSELAPIPGPGQALDAKEFSRISQIAHREAGLAIAPAKQAMVQTRLARRMRALRLTSYGDYCDFVESEAGREERDALICALTTHVSSFFREPHHFAYLQDHVIPDLSEQSRIRIWSAGCSQGQEPYSIAISLLEAQSRDPRATAEKDIKILATDIDPQVISFAQNGLYTPAMTGGIGEDLRARYFSDRSVGEGNLAIGAAARQLVTFRVLNLIARWPMRGRFDAVFCRNTVIYFDEDTQERLWQRFYEILRPGGWLFIGHSERISGEVEHLFKKTGNTVYRRC